MSIRFLSVLLVGFAAFSVLGCANQSAPILTANQVDLERFMGDWHVLGNVPTFIERKAYNSLESYELAEDGTVSTTFRFNKGALDGPEKTYRPRGFVRDTQSNAVWGMQFVWPFKAEYRILHVNAEYDQCIIGRSKRDYLWIMARNPDLPDAAYEKLVAIAEEQGYSPQDIRRVPHQ